MNTCRASCPREHLRLDYHPNPCGQPEGHDGLHVCSNVDSHRWSRYDCGLPTGHDGPCFEAWAIESQR